MKAITKIAGCAVALAALSAAVTVAVASQLNENNAPIDPAVDIQSNIPDENEAFPDAEPEESAPLESAPAESETEQEVEAAPEDDVRLSAEKWAAKPHTAPVAGTPEDFDFYDPKDNPAYKRSYTGYVFFPAEPDSEIYAVDDGEVIYAETGYSDGFGNAVVIKHADGVYCVYGHLDVSDERGYGIMVKKGDAVKAGQIIGYAGSSGAAARVGLGYMRYDEDPKLKPHGPIVKAE